MADQGIVINNPTWHSTRDSASMRMILFYFYIISVFPFYSIPALFPKFSIQLGLFSSLFFVFYLYFSSVLLQIVFICESFFFFWMEEYYTKLLCVCIFPFFFIPHLGMKRRIYAAEYFLMCMQASSKNETLCAIVQSPSGRHAKSLGKRIRNSLFSELW